VYRNEFKLEPETNNTQSRGLAMTVNTPRPNFTRPVPIAPSGQRLYLREEELDLGVAMIFDAGNIIKATTVDVRTKHNVNWTQARALVALMRVPQGVQALSVCLSVTKQAAIKTAEEFEARGLIKRSPDPRDGRRRTLNLTPTGEQIARDLGACMRGVLATAYRQAGGDAVTGCDAVLGALKKVGRKAKIGDAKAEGQFG
jgi:DNA-binding MarR family transcriptional regulator